MHMLHLTHATTWKNLKDIMLSEISQPQKENTVWFYLYEVPGVVKFTETGCQGWRYSRQVVFNEYRVSTGEDKKVLGMNSGYVFYHNKILLKQWFCFVRKGRSRFWLGGHMGGSRVPTEVMLSDLGGVYKGICLICFVWFSISMFHFTVKSF